MSPRFPGTLVTRASDISWNAHSVRGMSSDILNNCYQFLIFASVQSPYNARFAPRKSRVQFRNLLKFPYPSSLDDVPLLVVGLRPSALTPSHAFGSDGRVSHPPSLLLSSWCSLVPSYDAHSHQAVTHGQDDSEHLILWCFSNLAPTHSVRLCSAPRYARYSEHSSCLGKLTLPMQMRLHCPSLSLRPTSSASGLYSLQSTFISHFIQGHI
jgi:hypothetical protein